MRPPRFGFVDISSNSFPNVATYSCETGYKLIGPHQRSCLSTGDWSDAVPYCTSKNPVDLIKKYRTLLDYELITLKSIFSVVVDCGMVTSPLNGRVSAPGSTFEATASFMCDEGFRLKGSDVIRCLESGNWSAPAPTCDPIG